MSKGICELCEGLDGFSVFLWTGTIAGLFIGLGAELQSMALAKGLSSYLAAGFFSVGLCLVRMYNVPLYTGKVGTLWEEYGVDKLKAIPVLVGMFICNAFGAGVVGMFQSSWSIVRKLPSFDDWQVILPAMLCGALVHIGTRPGKNYLITVLCVVCFIVANGEHCVADMFHVARAGFPEGWLVWIVKVAIGNALGAWLIWLVSDLE